LHLCAAPAPTAAARLLLAARRLPALLLLLLRDHRRGANSNCQSDHPGLYESDPHDLGLYWNFELRTANPDVRRSGSEV
jgi:hypothetical protein